jgi:hypothetical protein
MHWDGSSNGLHGLARWLITPQLMRRAVSLRTAALMSIFAVACGSPTSPEDRAPDIVGTVLHLTTERPPALLVDRSVGDTALVRIWVDTQFYSRMPDGRLLSSDLLATAVGDSLEVWTTGAEFRSLPPQYDATQVVVW